MRSSILMTSALAMGVLAVPNPYPADPQVVTKTETVVQTVYVTLGANAGQPTSMSLARSTTAAKPATSSSVARVTSAASPTSAPISTARSQTQPQSSSASIQTPVVKAGGIAVGLGHPSGPSQAYLSAGPDYQSAVLYHHNAIRANHAASTLTWDADCEANARIAANRCRFEHYIPQGVRNGQNLFTTSGDAFNVTAGIHESWYKGELPPMKPYFGQNNIPDDVFHSVGHLTQVVWKGTTKVGCVSIDCGNRMIVNGAPSTLNKYTVCNYAGPGNVGGQYAANVAAPYSYNNLGSWSD